MLRLSTLLLFAASLASAQTCKTIALYATDAITAAPENHRILIETDDVRVLEVHSQPHTAENIHTHAYPAVMITDGFSTGSVTMEGQPPVFRSAPKDTSTPRVVFLPAQGPHHAENLGDTPFHSIRVELKHPGCSLSGQPPAALDATDALTAAPDSHKVLFENADMRVLDVVVPPHTAEPMHTHAWPSVMYIYQDATIRYSTPDHPGQPKSPPADWKPTPHLLKPEGLHSVENLGDTPFHAIRVELKFANPGAAAAKP